MKQHPVPQNISSYQFRLVGEMTLKQFLELAGGLVLAYFFLNINIHSFIKFPLVIFFGLAGFSLAFLPIQERPLDQWIINFIKSIYAPTKYLWQKNNQPPVFLQTKGVSVSVKSSTKKPLTKSKTVLTEYLQTLPIQKSLNVFNKFDKEEEKQLSNIAGLLQTIKLAQTSIPVKAKPTLYAAAQLRPTLQRPSKNQIVASAPPLTPPIMVNSLFPDKKKPKPAVMAMFPDKFLIPTAPEIPNVVVGMVVNNKGKILANTIIEIKNKQGITIRALKTNKLGQFFIANPLENGYYTLIIEHDDFDFDIIKLKTEGKKIPPIKIVAKNSKANKAN